MVINQEVGGGPSIAAERLYRDLSDLGRDTALPITLVMSNGPEMKIPGQASDNATLEQAGGFREAKKGPANAGPFDTA